MIEKISIAAQTHSQQELVLFLREYFAKQPEDFYKWHQDQTKTKITITTSYNDTQRFLIPAIVIEDVTGNQYNRVIGQEMITEIKGSKEINGIVYPNYVLGYNLHGVYDLRCNICIHDYNYSSRRRLTDLVGSAIRHIGIFTLKKRNIEIKGIESTGTKYRKIGNQLVQVDSLKIDFITNWNVKVTDLKNIEQILIKEINVTE